MLHPVLVVAAGVAGCAAVAVLLALPRPRRRGVLVLAALLGFAAGAAGLAVVPPFHPLHATASEVLSPAPRATPIRLTATWRPRIVHTGAGYHRIARWSVPAFPAQLRDDPLRPPVVLPAKGTIASVTIRGVRSHFAARPAIVYLPPAALVPQPRLLPVVLAFSGQSRGAGPQDLVWSAHLRSMMDRIAAKHDGVAPIVVVPDQLGPDSGNPMCVDSRLGHSATYILTDVRHWILQHLPVQPGRREWTVAGFSQGGTCSIQFAAVHPDVFGAVVDVSGEVAPVAGSTARTIRTAFSGDAEAYRHATPVWVMAHHHYRDLQAWFSAGALDTIYGPATSRIARAARAAGMTTHITRFAGIRHNWKVGSAGMAWAFDRLTGWWGI